MLICHFSDWHGHWKKLPKADLYICTGDMYKDYLETSGAVNIRETHYKQSKENQKINGRKLLGDPEAAVVVLRGNHDFLPLANFFGGDVHEINGPEDSFEFWGVKIGGMRGINYICGEWSDELREEESRDLALKLPLDLDILVTHAPPHGIRDKYLEHQFGRMPRTVHLGMQGLTNYLQRRSYTDKTTKKLRLHCFGHIHGEFGYERGGDNTLFSNAATGWNLIKMTTKGADVFMSGRQENNPMQQEVKERALARFLRAWREAEHIYSKRSSKEKEKLAKLGIKYSKRAKKLGEMFTDLENNPCGKCGRCCSKAAMDSGYYSHAERQTLLEKGVNLSDYLVMGWKEKPEPPERCLFLTEKGCNIPTEFRSSQCNTYVCYDRLGPKLVQLGLAPKYEKNRKKILKTLSRVKGLPRVPLTNCSKDFGTGQERNRGSYYKNYVDFFWDLTVPSISSNSSYYSFRKTTIQFIFFSVLKVVKPIN